jgi:phosphoglycolate phosphatase-like HAD superfamily hydrolase
MNTSLTHTGTTATPPMRKTFEPAHSYFIGIDSDGCVFDTMEMKQMQCFCPAVIQHFQLHAISDYVEEAWRFVTLYSRQRGVNRFVALVETIKLLKQHPQIGPYRDILPDLEPLVSWISKEPKLGNPALKSYAATVQNPIVDETLKWSLDANDRMIRNIGHTQPFAGVRTAFQAMQSHADIAVISQCSEVVLEREWNDHRMDNWVRGIAGQEYGSKSEQLSVMAGGQYPLDHMMMIGDAPGDMTAALNNGVLFYPIIPGEENMSWKRFEATALDRFLQEQYAGDYQDSLIREYDDHLAVRPPWSQKP